MKRASRAAVGASLLALSALTSTQVSAQGLVEYALILVLAGGGTEAYELCGTNPHEDSRAVTFTYEVNDSRSLDLSSNSELYDVKEIELSLMPGETKCETFQPPAAGRLSKIVYGPPGLAKKGKVPACSVANRIKDEVPTQVWITQDGGRVGKAADGVVSPVDALLVINRL